MMSYPNRPDARKRLRWESSREKFGVEMALVSGGVLCVVSVIGAALFLPKFLSYDGSAKV
jgi:hypothetical protein